MNQSDVRPLPLILMGAGGHAKVLLSLARACGYDVVGVCDPGLVRQGISHWRGIAVLGADDVLDQYAPSDIELINGIGQVVGGNLRRVVHESASAKGFRFPPLVHPAAWLDDTVVLEEGVQVMAGAILQADVRIGCASIVNTSASIDHDSRVAAHVHVAPGVTLCGGVTVAEGAFIGSGSTVIQGVVIGEDALVGAGTVVVRDVPARGVLIGPSARTRSVPDS
ncbi:MULTISPECIES: acetyltransferase [unclassified Pseudomonas]|uniref:acetyltransferase n=1 Tax=unclassified Pseudomonas TaxID=196821 RepID=UPI0021C8D5C7|nr:MULTISPECIES: acetyltransferase [unclassified Pseudomonas]MCU1733991.1 acetyltransferase [Pseudomonas sp. 20P_3.2_Bac4]MCU1742341.1 acetyltransferase [Pseudomonas sp. 20P_3.2_Bac5]